MATTTYPRNTRRLTMSVAGSSGSLSIVFQGAVSYTPEFRAPVVLREKGDIKDAQAGEQATGTLTFTAFYRDWETASPDTSALTAVLLYKGANARANFTPTNGVSGTDVDSCGAIPRWTITMVNDGCSSDDTETMTLTNAYLAEAPTLDFPEDGSAGTVSYSLAFFASTTTRT